MVSAVSRLFPVNRPRPHTLLDSVQLWDPKPAPEFIGAPSPLRDCRHAGWVTTFTPSHLIGGLPPPLHCLVLFPMLPGVVAAAALSSRPGHRRCPRHGSRPGHGDQAVATCVPCRRHRPAKAFWPAGPVGQGRGPVEAQQCSCFFFKLKILEIYLRF
jgi:hypothetical protein